MLRRLHPHQPTAFALTPAKLASAELRLAGHPLAHLASASREVPS